MQKNKEEKRKKQTAHRIALLIADVFLIVAVALGSYWMTSWGMASRITLPLPVVLWTIGNVALCVSVFYAMGLYHMLFSAVSLSEAIRVTLSAAIVFVVNTAFVFIFDLFSSALRSTYYLGYNVMAIYSALLLVGTTLLRFSKRIVQEIKVQFSNVFTKKKRVMIVGFNSSAFALIRSMAFAKNSAFKPVCIVDEDERLLGKKIYSVRVVGTLADMKMCAKRFGVQEIFLVVPSMTPSEQKQLLQICAECGCPIRKLPELNEMTHGELMVSKLRHVSIDDLLGREQKCVNVNEIIGYIEHKVVLVTGGGGSIGSELCRQIALHNPRQLIILDIYENNAYDIEQELKRAHPELNLLTLIASVRDKGKMRDVFEKYRPQIVFNAAAHKHVPLMETSPNEAVKNNVFGTLNVARLADEFQTETFVQISTDKAVNPTNIMGATKRICEMIVQTIGRNSKHTKFVAVRFGNVLGSNGSVIPLFKRQIAEGGPVTVTHKDIIRYFMTIPEAVSLVLQAGAYAQNGQIFVLDMGEPVRIYDLAYNLIKLSGLEPNVDIEIKCTGLRPGEKLYEERLMAEEGLQKTPNGLINIAKPIPVNEMNFWSALDRLYTAAYEETDKMKDWVKMLVPTYTIDRGGNAAKEYLRNEAESLQETAVTAG